MKINYKTWGLGGEKGFQYSKLIPDDLKNAEGLATKFFIKKDCTLTFNAQVSYYQGRDKADLNLIFLKYYVNTTQQLTNGGNIFFLVDTEKRIMMGINKLTWDKTGVNLVSFQQALIVSVKFLSLVAPELVAEDSYIPCIDSINHGSKLEFPMKTIIGKLELHWVGYHEELYSCRSISEKITGIKVKFYDPENQLWTWVIVDKNGQVMTYERDVNWDFIKTKRGTEMWMHEGWLLEHKIDNSE